MSNMQPKQKSFLAEPNSGEVVYLAQSAELAEANASLLD